MKLRGGGLLGNVARPGGDPHAASFRRPHA
jgi:hypothetical protein